MGSPTIISSPTGALDQFSPSSLYLIAIQSGSTSRQLVCVNWPVGSILQLDDTGSIQIISTGSSSGVLPLSCMDLTVVAPIIFDPTAKTIGLSFGGTTLQYVRGDGALAEFPTVGTAAATNSSSYDAAGAAATAQAFSIQRANHTGTQTASTISDFSTAAIASVTWSTLTGKPTFSTVATSGSYADLSGSPALGTQITVDPGWTANNTAGDKTAALSYYSNGLNSTIITAMNLAAANSGTAISAALDVLVVVVKQLAAVRTALVVAKIPNV